MKRFSGKTLMILVLIIAAVAALGYRYRGFARIKMLQFLHSFDDVPVAVEEENELPPGLWWQARSAAVHSQDDLSPRELEQVELLRSLGYLSGYVEVPVEMGVTVFDSTRACPGYNLVLSGHGPGISLIDMNGEVVHSWFSSEVSLYGIWPEAQDQGVPIDFWRRAYLSDNGDLTVVVEAGGIVRIDLDSNLLWHSEANGAHHDLDIDQNGNVYTIGRLVHQESEHYPGKLISEDYIVRLDSAGNETLRLSTLDVLANSQYAPVLRDTPEEGDVLHCNTIVYVRPEMLPENYTGPFRPNSVILSLRAVDLICAVDLEEESVYWAQSELWHMQHEPVVLSDGSMLIFDNQGMGEMSTVLQFDPVTSEVLWYYRGTRENPFYSVGVGSCQRLPNGNTLIVESVMGRAFEVTPEGETVWEYFNPHRAGDNHELIATLFDTVRILPETVSDWL